MTDATLPGGSAAKTIRRPDLSEARLRKRYGAERRFRFYGLAAIGIAMLMLVVLLSSIISKGWPAFLQSYVTLEVTFDADKVKADGTGDFRQIMIDALQSRFPEVTDRRARADLRGLLSNDTDIRLREYLLDHPDALGQTRQVRVMAGGDMDTYLKGQSTEVTDFPGNGIASLIDLGGGQMRILVGANAFSRVLAEAKVAMQDAARQMERDLFPLERRVEALRAELPGTSGAARDAAAADLAAAERQLAAAQAEIEDLRQRAAAPGGTETLRESLPSFVARVNGGAIRLTEVGNDHAVGNVLLAPDSLAEAPSGTWSVDIYQVPESDRRFKDRQIAWVKDLEDSGQVEMTISDTFFTAGASREPEQAGIWGAAVGSILTLIICLALSFPVAVLAAVYLEEFAPKNRLTDLIEVNINNLAAVPSIVFGLLGLAVFLNFFNLPRSAPLVGGMVLALMTLPTIIIAARAALKAVPPSIREAALGVGASKLQTITHHVLPLAMPGILTGTIIGMAQALGETAPLLMIGMVAFVVDIPGGFTDPATVLPVQIYMWADFPERAFEARTSAAIMVLLAFLVVMNALAVVLRKRFERRW